MSDDPTGAGIPTDPRLDWRARLPMPGTRSATDRPATRPPINAPPAPQQLHAPHNLFTLEEVVEALALLAEGVKTPLPAHVLVRHTNGGSSVVAIGDLPRINYVTDVASVEVFWTYQDTSSVAGALVQGGLPGRLTVEGGGQALAAAQHCLEHLRALRPWRAGLRGWLAGRGPEGLYLLALTVIFIVYLTNVEGATDTFTGLGSSLTRAAAIAVVFLTVAAWLVSKVIATLFARARRRIGGTRVGTASRAQRTWLTPELGVLAAVIGVPIALASLIVAVIAL